MLNLSIKAQARQLEGSAASSIAVPAPVLVSMSVDDYSQEQPPTDSVAVSILEPCNITLDANMEEGRQQMGVEMSEMRLKMSPDVLQLVQHLQQVGVAVGGSLAVFESV
jgi:hypothetical protein